jgi:peptidoglycan-associated lipoprotein
VPQAARHVAGIGAGSIGRGERGACRRPGGRRDRCAVAATPPRPSEFKATESLKDIHFDFDKYEIRPEDARILDADAAWLKSRPNDLMLIEGHCDERGTSEYNLALGERRAKAAMTYLVGQGIQAQRITLISYGKEQTVCSTHDEACWALNRRAHFLVKSR